MKLRSVVLPWVLGASILTACGSDDDKTPEQEWFAKYADALCTGMNKCCKEAGQPNEIDVCKQFYMMLGGMGLESAMSKGATFNASAGEQCLADIPAQFQDCSTAGEEPDSCSRVIVGKTAPGGTCSTDFDCAPPVEGRVRCLWSSSSGSDDTTSKCQVVLPAKAGESCANDNESPTVRACNEDPLFYCDYTAKVCKNKVPIGGACESATTCTDDAYCDWSGTSTCVAKAGIGQACGANGAQCDEDTYCGDGQTCLAKKAAGESCSGFDECKGYCTNDKCEASSAGTMCFTSE